MTHMARLTITLPNATLRHLRARATERNTSVSAVVRDAIEEKLSRQRPKLRSVGLGSSGFSDTARLAGEIPLEPRSFR